MSYVKSNTLLSISADAKTVKGNKVGVMTGILYLAPHNLSGYQVCPKASDGCKAGCLYTAGRGIYSKTQNGRLNKTKYFFNDRQNFMATLVKNIEALVRKAERQNMIAAVRLNGTSDIGWEKIVVNRGGITYRNIMQAFRNVQFYDYTKIVGRKAALAEPNYHLTFSLSENNQADAKIAIETGYNVAVVVNTKRKQVKPKTYSGYPTVNGDENDVRFFDPKGGHIVLLTAKGKARKDTSGFVKDINAATIFDTEFSNVLTNVA
jgi:hypothetical protein